jgi:LmbE family N-acetylglucosaminyl deacetylase
MKNRLGKTLKLSAITFIAVVCITAITALAIQFRIHVSNEWQQYKQLPTVKAPGKGKSVIVFAPHSDDETLGCGGLLALTKARGAKVHVVLVTNGDGFRIAVGRAYKTFKVTPLQCVNFAYRRQKESLKALSILGIHKNEVIFLGYPDRGLARLWDTNWNDYDLYTSHATNADHSPYINSLTPLAPYCGESLLKDIENTIKDIKPTDIYFPHPYDNHSDHYATGCFVQAAIEQLRSEGYPIAKKIAIHTYLVHRGDWPTPKGNHPDEPLAPPHGLTNGETRWASLKLPPDVVRKKLLAIKAYKTQMAIEPTFLKSFARKNEIFGNLPERRIALVQLNAIKIDGDPKDWRGIAPIIVDPVGDYVMAGMNKSGDVRAVYACADANYLYIRMDCVKRISKRVTYTFNFRGVNNANADDHFSVSIKPTYKFSPFYLKWAKRGNTIEFAIPRKHFKLGDDLFVQVSTKMMKLKVDKTGWQSVEIEG